MILLCGIPSEPPLALAIQAAQAAEVEYALLNQRELPFSDMQLGLSPEGVVAGTLSLRGSDWPLESFAGVYFRMMEYQSLPENMPRGRTPPDRNLYERSRLFQEAFLQWLEISQARILNRPSDMASNLSKPYQAQLIARGGFLTPRTLVTNDPAEVQDFASRAGRVVYKSISSVRSIVRELADAGPEALERVRVLPTQFQEFVPGINIRVHVIGEQVFATEVVTEAVDYRYAGNDGLDAQMRPIELPDAVASRCVDLSRALRLPFCGIDLKRTPEGEYYCFEANPSPAYSCYEEQTGQPIARALVEYLASERE